MAHIVTLLSADGAYGGPARVVEGQVKELAARNHDVTVFAGWDGSAPARFPSNVRARLFRAYPGVPGAGFAGLIAPRLTAAVARLGAEFDIVHVHLARDLITMPAAALVARRGRLVVQPHGMIQPDSRVKSRLADLLSTRRVLRQAGAVLFLTPVEERGLRAVAPRSRLSHLPNGIDPISSAETKREPGVVLFCARLHPRKRVLAFVEMARLLVQRGVQARFVIAGPDGGDLPKLQSALAQLTDTADIRYVGAVQPDQVTVRLASAAVFVLPSIDEPFPMTVLESMAAGTPVVLTDTCGLATDLSARGAAVVTDGSVGQLADAVAALLNSPGARRTQAAAGLLAIREEYSISSVIDQLETIYRSVEGAAPKKGVVG